MGTGETTSYHLRRIGPSATCMSISNIMKLKYGVTKFGRATSNDYYLDSTKLKNFISRIHAEIHAIPCDNGDVQFRIVDKGLNGTFINDTKMSGPYILKVGDKVTFGHTNGYKLKAGDYAKQPNSEFQFIFEKLIQKEEERGFRTGDEAAINGHVPANASSSANTITSHSIKKSPSKTDQKYNLSKDTTVTYTASPTVNRYSGFDLKSSPSNSEDSEEEEEEEDYKPKVNTLSRKSFPVRSRYDDSDDSMDSSPSPKPVRKSSGYPDKKQSPPGKVKKSASRLSGENGFTPLSDLARKDKSSKTKTSRVNVNININVESTVKNSGSRTSNSMRERDTPPSTTHLEIPNIHRRKLLNEKQRHRSSSSSDDSNDLPSPDEDSSRDPFFSSEENTDIKTKNKKKSPVEKKVAKPAKVQRSNSKGSMREAKKRKPGPVKPGKPGRRGRPPKKKKRDSDEDDDDDDDDDFFNRVETEDVLEDGVEWFEEDKCASGDCKRPKGKRVAWVACDDCDKWYHTECVGCRYDHVKDSDIKFSCGCR